VRCVDDWTINELGFGLTRPFLGCDSCLAHAAGS
jgi:hypothetical protein